MRFIGYKYSEDKIKWKTIYVEKKPTKYSVSNIGLIRNDKTGKILKTNFSHGYERIGLTINRKQETLYVHRLVAEAFIPNPENKPEVNHIDADKSHNYDSNLEWCTRTENQIHASKIGLSNAYKNQKHLTQEQVEQICLRLEENKLNQVQIAKEVGCARISVYNILNKRSYTNISSHYQIDNYTIKQPKDYVVCGEKLPNTKYNSDDVRKVCELIDKGKYTLREIEAKTDIPYQTIRNIFYGTCRKDISKDYNFMKTKERVYENKGNKIKKVCELLDQGFNTREVAEKTGIPRSTIRKVLSGSTWKSISKDFNFMKNKN